MVPWKLPVSWFLVFVFYFQLSGWLLLVCYQDVPIKMLKPETENKKQKTENRNQPGGRSGSTWIDNIPALVPAPAISHTFETTFILILILTLFPLPS
jgi:hypothetical protein